MSGLNVLNNYIFFTIGEVWSILAKQRHRNLWTNPSDPFRHCWIGNVLCSYICTLQGIYPYVYLLYTLKFKCRQLLSTLLSFSSYFPLPPFLPTTAHPFFISFPALLSPLFLQSLSSLSFLPLSSLCFLQATQNSETST